MIASSRRLALLCAASTLVATPALADDPLAAQFRDPPQSARPLVWWHWMNGNISQDGIRKDLAWMHEIGIGGVQVFDANLATPQIVPQRLTYMTPPWQDAFRLAVHEADRLGMELGIASSPGWSETGGPWVPPADAMKKLVWSEVTVPGGVRAGALPPLPQTTGPFQSLTPPMSIEDMIAGPSAHHVAPPQAGGAVAVLAVPVAVAPAATPRLTLGDGTAMDLDGGARVPAGTADAPTAVVMTYAAPQTMRSFTFFAAGVTGMFTNTAIAPRLEASDDGHTWRKVADVPARAVPSTVSFPPVTARLFRLVLAPLAGGGQIGLGGPPPGVASPFPPPPANAPAPTIDLREAHLSPEARVDQGEVKAGFAVELDYNDLPPAPDAATGAAPAQVLDLTSRVKPDGTLDWTAPKLPKGQAWRVLRLGWSLIGTTNHPATPEATGLEVDKFDAAAVGRYMDHYLASYRETVGPENFGAHGIRAMVTDSTEVGAANWTPEMVAKFKALRGYDPMPWLPVLTGMLIGSRADSDRFLADFRRTIADLTATEHYRTVDNAARAAGLTVYGESLEDHRPSLGDDMQMRRYTDVPMAAMWTYPQGGSARATYLADDKGASSVAHIWGQQRVAAESMTSFMNPWGDSPRTLKHVIDTEFIQGINRPVIHDSAHQPVDDKVPGLSLFVFGQYFTRHESWAGMALPWIDYIARNALMLQQGRNVADVAYFHGEDTPLTALYGDKPVADAPRAWAYDFVDGDALINALGNDGDALVTPGGARYRALYLGGEARHMSLAALRKIAALVEGGATVIGPRPTGSQSLADATPQALADYTALVARLWPGAPVTQVGKGRVVGGTDVAAGLAAIGVKPDFAFTGGSARADIPFVHRHLADGEDYFVVNRGPGAETIEAHLRVTGKVPELWHAETGTAEPVSYRIVDGETIVPLTLAAEEAVHIVLRRDATAASATVAAPVTGATVALDGPWTLAFQPGRGAPATATLPALAPLNTSTVPGIRYFSGVVTYSRDVIAPKGWKAGTSLWLDLGDVRELAEVAVNGRAAGGAWHPPYRVDIGAVVHPGHNRLEVKVADLWVNRLIGDAQQGAAKITWTPLPTYTPDAALKPSGLIGPVTLTPAR